MEKTDLAAADGNSGPFHNPMAAQIWDMKYRLKDQDGNPVDATVEDTWRRVADAIAERYL